MRITRLFLEENSLTPKQLIEIKGDDFDYLTKVMRKKMGEEIAVFNGKNGEFLAQITEVNKKNCQIQIKSKSKEQYFPPKITLAFAPIKNVGIDMIAKKATELGISSFRPLITNHSVVDKINLERFKANVKEAAEQCERLDIPRVHEIIKLEDYLKNCPEKTQLDSEDKETKNQILILCDESGEGESASIILPKIKTEILKVSLEGIDIAKCDDEKKEIIIFIGPEGGFSQSEFKKFRKLKNLYSLNLGPRILRADTAMIAAITLVQEFLGDFELKCKF